MLDLLHAFIAHAPHLATGAGLLLGGAGVANIPFEFHMNGGNLLGMKTHIHLGNANFDADLAEAGTSSSIRDLFAYAKEAGHTDRAHAPDFDTKMTAIYGSAYTNLDAAYKDAVFLNARAFPFTPQ